MNGLPVLDLSELDDGADAAVQFGEQVLAAAHDVGFFVLTGHGIPDDVVARAFATASDFFALPDEDKLSVEMLRSPHFRGYTRTGGELTGGAVDWREQIDLGAEREPVVGGPAYLRLEGPNQWPSAQPDLREVFGDWERRGVVVATRLMHAWAGALGCPSDAFDGLFGDRPSTLIKLIRYPGRDERGQGVGAHKDPGVLTLLMVEPGKGGLQVEHGDEWVDVSTPPGAFVVNTGELLEYATDGYLKATRHRVVSPPAGESRLSIPFFYNPALDSTVPRIPLPAGLTGPGVTQDPANVISGTFGENLLKARLRAHPDVAERHHADLLAETRR
ncbi:isopenicillin N synthase family dioxygenase [Jatrophihabitans fulvus]